MSGRRPGGGGLSLGINKIINIESKFCKYFPYAILSFGEQAGQSGPRPFTRVAGVLWEFPEGVEGFLGPLTGAKDVTKICSCFLDFQPLDIPRAFFMFA